MKIAKIPLQPFSRFHFGEFKIDINVALSSTSTFAHSDTLFSALINSYSKKYNDTESFIKSFEDNKLKISSLFYYIENEKTCIYLFPKPVFLDLYSIRDGQHKKRNRILFVSQGVWNNGFDTSQWVDSEGNAKDGFLLLQEGEVLITIDEAKSLGLKAETFIFKIVDNPKNPIRKAHKDDAIFYQSDVEIAKIKDVTTGIYFLYCAEYDAELKLKTSTNIMAYSGIGGEKGNTGRTMLSPVFGESIDFIPKLNGLESGFINLSLINPTNEKELKEIEFFKTILRGGSGFDSVGYHKIVRMIKEGALIKEDSICGQLVDITGENIKYEHKILRNGKALLVPINYKK